MYELLEKINSPADLKALPPEDLERLCQELRDYIINCCAENPGHLASSLGAVELIVGYHYVFDSPADKIVFDVGHQAYAHKILTGRREAFKENRKEGGLAGFPSRSESEYDAFGAGHSSTSVSAALGLAEAARQQGLRNKVVALIGDGALTGGLALEGLNNAGSGKADLLVILNDNNQSIDGNTGALHNNLLRITSSVRYNRLKNHIWNRLGPSRLRESIQRLTHNVKSSAVRDSGGDLFEALGFRYFGPIDGNDIAQVVTTLRKLKNIGGPRLLHCYTVKGKGYPAAEQDPVVWHAPGRFDPKTGERIKGAHKADRYQDVFGATLCDLAEDDPRIVGITPAMATGCGMTEFARRFPDRFYDVGIEEEHAATFSAGLAAGGLRPVCNIYSSFAQRSYDQIIHDVALQGLPVVFCFDRAGLVGEDGATHQGAFDMAAYRSIPGTTVAAPKDEVELRNLMFTALQQEHGPFIIRYPRGTGEGLEWKGTPFSELPVGKAYELLYGADVAIVSTGPVTNRALEAASAFPGRVGVYHFPFVKPLDTAMLDKIASRYAQIITAEDGCLAGGFFGAVSEYFTSHACDVSVHPLGIADEFVAHAPQARQRQRYSLDADSMQKILQKFLQNSK
ncbi:MAG: 1-deoxy-D-xylulose-5-phosphate synthase [Bacteroidales bacterium]|nr:1-deoxy-D-xylulose-5-phosphate synthase [Bacteroidales bacterium]